MVRGRRVDGATGDTYRESGGRAREQPEDQRRQELFPEPDLDLPIIPKDP